MNRSPSPPTESLEQAVALHRRGRLREAQTLYERLLSLQPGNVQLTHLRALSLLQQGRLDEGIASLSALLRDAPGHGDSLHALGGALKAKGADREAEALFEQALALDPNRLDTIIELGHCWTVRKNHAGAEELYRKAVARWPEHAGLRCCLGTVLSEARRDAEAIAAFEKALALQPHLVEAKANLALVFRRSGRLGDAIRLLREAIASRPDQPELHYNLGVALYLRTAHAEATIALERALELKPDFRKAAMQLLRCRQAMCDWDGVERLLPSARAEARRALEGKDCALLPFVALTIPLSEAERAAVAAAYCKTAWRGREQVAPAVRAGQRSGERLHIGYVCGDVRDHATAHLTRGMFALHDRSRFVISLYAYGPGDDSPYRRDILAGCDRAVDLTGVGDEEASQRIAGDGVDILVDLNGHTTNGRLGIFALRPAPVQATYLAFPGTTGADFIDYMIVDKVVVPPEAAPHYSEKPAWLPDSYQVNDWRQPVAPAISRADEGLPPDAVVFCCFCGSHKITREAFALWMRILLRAPSSVLWLLAGSTDGEANLRRAASAANLAAGRLIFARPKPKPEHLARLALADLFLDTLIYGAHTTASDALWAGVPVITRLGETFASRVGASLLDAIGIPELVAPDLGVYEETAVKLAGDGAARARLKERLGKNRLTHPLFDTGRTVRHLEAAFRLMWENYLAGRPPSAITVPALQA